MRILVVAMSDSIHTARWLSQLTDQNWDVHLFPVEETVLHPNLRNVSVHTLFRQRYSDLHPSVRQVSLPWPFKKGAIRAQRGVEQLPSGVMSRATRLARTIRQFKPDIVHSLEMQHGAYLTLESRKRLVGHPFPPWIYSSWGSDIFYFGRHPNHQKRIREVLASCDYYISECQRDVRLAREFGFGGEVLGILPAVGGFDLERVAQFRQTAPPSSRRVIALKGYHDDNWAGRALVGIQALQTCADILSEYRVQVYSASSNVRAVIDYVARATKLPFAAMPPSSPDEMLALMGRSRIAMGVNVTDGVPLTMLEAIMLGAFPIQSDTGSTAEWITHGENGLLVSPDDPASVAAAIQRAVTDDDLVNRAAEINARIAAERLDRSVIQPQVTKMYTRVAVEAHS